MKRTLAVIAVWAALLWAGAAFASNAGGLPACRARLNLETGLYNTCSDNLTTAQLCGNDAIDPGEQCDQNNLNGQTCASQGFIGGTLKCWSGCQFDTSGCTNTRYTDNGDGTVTDNQTGLMWEQTTGTIGTVPTNPPATDVNNRYAWSTGDNLADGTAFTSFLATLNNGASTDGGATTAITGCFANHCDWRLPSIVELQGIIDFNATGCSAGTSVCIDPVFGPTQAGGYWSATTNAGYTGFPGRAWFVDFDYGLVGDDYKTFSGSVRAVRSGK